MSEPDARSARRFLWLWGVEMLSITGTGLTAFALGAWVYGRTGSATSFALLSVASILPGIVLLPLSGALADVLPRRAVMWSCNLVAGLAGLGLLGMVMMESMAFGAMYVLLAVSALCRALQWVTFTATMTQMVPVSQLGRMSGLIYLGEAGQRLLAPAIAAFALPWIGYEGVMGMDVATFALALVVLTALPLPRLPETQPEPIRRVLAQGWSFLRARPGLLWLQGFFALSQFLGGFLPILTLPVLMELTGSIQVTGVVMGCGGLGLVAGAACQGVWPARVKRVRRTLVLDVCASLTLVVLAVGAPYFGAIWIAITGFGFLFFHSLESGVSQDFWQREVPAELQGRVFAIRRAISWSLVPVCYALAGPLVDDLLTPWLEARPEWTATPKLIAMLALMGAGGALRAGVLAPLAWRIESLRALDESVHQAG